MEKTILLTGASSGIGNSIAKILAQKDFFVYAIVRKVEDKKAFENFDNIKVFLADITKEEDITKLKQEIYSQNNKITGIINNAGVAFTSINEYPEIDDLKAQFEINTFAPLRIVKEFLPLMDEGKIINISSVSSNVVYPFISPYCASKKALDIFFQALDIELNNPKIKIVSIKPSVVQTPIWQKSYMKAQQRFEKLPFNIREKYSKRFKKLLEKSEANIKHGLKPEEVAKLVLKILNSQKPKSSYCIGFGSYIGVFINKLSPELQIKIAKILSK